MANFLPVSFRIKGSLGQPAVIIILHGVCCRRYDAMPDLLNLYTIPVWVGDNTDIRVLPTMTLPYIGRPTIEGKTGRGVSPPTKLALTIPDPLSTRTTRALTSSFIIRSVTVTITGWKQQRNENDILIERNEINVEMRAQLRQTGYARWKSCSYYPYLGINLYKSTQSYFVNLRW